VVRRAKRAAALAVLVFLYETGFIEAWERTE